MIQTVLEVMWDKVEYALRYSQKMTGQLEECPDSKVMQSVLNGRTSKNHFGLVRFHMLPRSHKFSHGLFLNNSLQVWLIGRKIDHVIRFRYIKHDGEVSRLVI